MLEAGVYTASVNVLYRVVTMTGDSGLTFAVYRPPRTLQYIF